MYTRKFKKLVKNQHLSFRYLANEKLDFKATGRRYMCINNFLDRWKKNLNKQHEIKNKIYTKYIL